MNNEDQKFSLAKDTVQKINQISDLLNKRRMRVAQNLDRWGRSLTRLESIIEKYPKLISPIEQEKLRKIAVIHIERTEESLAELDKTVNKLSDLDTRLDEVSRSLKIDNNINSLMDRVGVSNLHTVEDSDMEEVQKIRKIVFTLEGYREISK